MARRRTDRSPHFLCDVFGFCKEGHVHASGHPPRIITRYHTRTQHGPGWEGTRIVVD